jgi:hypothetical protein
MQGAGTRGSVMASAKSRPTLSKVNSGELTVPRGSVAGGPLGRGGAALDAGEQSFPAGAVRHRPSKPPEPEIPEFLWFDAERDQAPKEVKEIQRRKVLPGRGWNMYDEVKENAKRDSTLRAADRPSKSRNKACDHCLRTTPNPRCYLCGYGEPMTNHLLAPLLQRGKTPKTWQTGDAALKALEQTRCDVFWKEGMERPQHGIHGREVAARVNELLSVRM